MFKRNDSVIYKALPEFGVGTIKKIRRGNADWQSTKYTVYFPRKRLTLDWIPEYFLDSIKI